MTTSSSASNHFALRGSRGEYCPSITRSTRSICSGGMMTWGTLGSVVSTPLLVTDHWCPRHRTRERPRVHCIDCASIIPQLLWPSSIICQMAGINRLNSPHRACAALLPPGSQRSELHARSCPSNEAADATATATAGNRAEVGKLAAGSLRSRYPSWPAVRLFV